MARKVFGIWWVSNQYELLLLILVFRKSWMLSLIKSCLRFVYDWCYILHQFGGGVLQRIDISPPPPANQLSEHLPAHISRDSKISLIRPQPPPTSSKHPRTPRTPWSSFIPKGQSWVWVVCSVVINWLHTVQHHFPHCCRVPCCLEPPQTACAWAPRWQLS